MRSTDRQVAGRLHTRHVVRGDCTWLWCYCCDKICLQPESYTNTFQCLESRRSGTCYIRCPQDHILPWWQTHTDSKGENNTSRAVAAGKKIRETQSSYSLSLDLCVCVWVCVYVWKSLTLCMSECVKPAQTPHRSRFVCFQLQVTKWHCAFMAALHGASHKPRND